METVNAKEGNDTMNTYKITIGYSRTDDNGRIRHYEKEIGREIAKNRGAALRQMWDKAIESGIATSDMFVSFNGAHLSVIGVGVFKARKVAAS